MFVYRFVKLAEFIDIAVHQRMTLTQIASWPDKHETATLATALKYRTRHTALDVPAHERADDTRQRIEALRSAYFNIYLQSQYAMCFTTKENSDAMWKVFAGETGVRLAIDCDLLLPALQKENANVKGGDVSYHPEGKPMSEVLKESGISQQNPLPLVSCCFVKRDAFEHEKEYRFCVTQYPEGYDAFVEPMTALLHKLYVYENEKTGEFDGSAVDRMIGRIQRFTFPRHIFFPFDPQCIVRVTLAPNCEWLEPAARNLSAPWKAAIVDTSSLYEPPW